MDAPIDSNAFYKDIQVQNILKTKGGREKIMDQNLAAILIALVAASPGIISLWKQSRNEQKTIPQSLASEGLKASETAVTLVRQYSEEIQKVKRNFDEVQDMVDSLGDKLEKQNRLVDEMSRGIERLCAQIVSLGQIPVWKPDEVKKQLEEIRCSNDEEDKK